jgi:hypothetical protein
MNKTHRQALYSTPLHDRLFRSVGPKTQALGNFLVLALQPSVNWRAEYVLQRSYETL